MPRNFSPQELDNFGRSISDSEWQAMDQDPRQQDRPEELPALRVQARSSERSLEERMPQRQFPNGRAALYDRDRGYRLTESEIHTIAELGKFRVVAAGDLAQHICASNREEARRAIGNLVRLGLARKGTVEGPEASPRELLTLTKRGHCLLRANHLVPRNQATYHGFVKRREANHDADLYRLYQKEAARIAAQGGRNLRVVLDYELKRRVNRDIARFGVDARPEIAARHGLEVVRNKIPVPDLRIEYQTRDCEVARVNLELVTEHYRGCQVAEKVRAGFSLYTPRGEAARLRRVLDQRELTADISSL